jgi:O-antigen/teichoic acid export membrane protein
MANVSQSAAGFLIVAYIGRSLGAMAFGEYIVAYSWYFLLVPIATLGFRNTLIRRLARLGDDRGYFACRSLALVLLSGTLCGVVMIVGATIVGHSAASMQAILLLASTMGLTTLLPVVYSILISQEKAGIVLLSELTQILLRVAISLILIRLGYGIVWLIGTFVAVYLASLALCMIFLKRYKLLTWKGKAGQRFSVKESLAETLPFVGINWVNMAYWRIGLLILSKVQGEAAVGVYSAANKLFQVIQFVPDSFLLAIFPLLSRGFTSGHPAFKRLTEIGVRYLFAACLLPVIVLTLTAHPVIKIVYDNPVFQEAETILKILTWTLIPYAGFRLFVCLMMAANQEWSLVKLVAVSTAAGVVASALLIHNLGPLGLAIATALTLSGVCVLLGPFVYRHLNVTARMLDWRRLAKIALAGIIAGGIGYSLRPFGWPLTAAASSISYVVLVLLSRAISPEEIGLPSLTNWRKKKEAIAKPKEDTPPSPIRGV